MLPALTRTEVRRSFPDRAPFYQVGGGLLPSRGMRFTPKSPGYEQQVEGRSLRLGPCCIGADLRNHGPSFLIGPFVKLRPNEVCIYIYTEQESQEYPSEETRPEA